MNAGEWKACAIALESFPGEFSPRSAEAYRALLEGLEYEEVMGAIRRHVRKGMRWRPAPGEIVALAGRSVALPPFGPIRQALTLACQSTPVRVARSDVTAAICAQVQSPLITAYVKAVGGERIRRVVLYVADEQVERSWQALERDYNGLEAELTDLAFTVLDAQPRPELTA